MNAPASTARAIDGGSIRQPKHAEIGGLDQGWSPACRDIGGRAAWGALLLSALLLLEAPAAAFAQAPLARVSLDDALQLALRQNATLRAKEDELRSTRANEITAALRPNPTASYAAEQFGLPGTDPQHTIIIGQTIELGGKRRRRLESARAATRVTGFQLAEVRRQTILQVQTAFTNALVAREALALAEANLKTLDETERISRIRVQAGDLSELEFLRIQVQRFTFERDAEDARQALAAAKFALRTAVGADGLAPDFEIVGTLDFREFTLDRDQLVGIAYANRPDLKAAEADRARATADHNLARANAWWDVTPQIEYQRIGRDNTVGVGLSMPLRIFDRNQGEIARTQSEINRVSNVLRAIELGILSDVDTDLKAALTQLNRVKELGDFYLPRAARARDTVEFAFRNGGLSLLDLLDAQRTYRETALAHVQALGAYRSAIYQLEADIGQPFER